MKSTMELLKEIKKLTDQIVDTDVNNIEDMFKNKDENMAKILSDIRKELDNLEFFTRSDLKRSGAKIFTTLKNYDIDPIKDADLHSLIKYNVANCTNVNLKNSEIKRHGGYLKRGFTFEISPKNQTGLYRSSIIFTVYSDKPVSINIAGGAPLKIPQNLLNSTMLDEDLKENFKNLAYFIDENVFEFSDLKTVNKAHMGRNFKTYVFESDEDANRFIETLDLFKEKYGVLCCEDNKVFVARMDDNGE